MPIIYSRYPSEWTTEIVPRILERANNRCERCGLENEQTVYSISLRVQDDDGRYKVRAIWLRSYGDALRTARYRCEEVKSVSVSLQVAHLDHDEENHQVTNDRLMAMCQLCHLNYDAKEKYRRLMAGMYTKRR